MEGKKKENIVFFGISGTGESRLAALLPAGKAVGWGRKGMGIPPELPFSEGWGGSQGQGVQWGNL